MIYFVTKFFHLKKNLNKLVFSMEKIMFLQQIFVTFVKFQKLSKKCVKGETIFK